MLSKHPPHFIHVRNFYTGISSYKPSGDFFFLKILNLTYVTFSLTWNCLFIKRLDSVRFNSNLNCLTSLITLQPTSKSRSEISILFSDNYRKNKDCSKPLSYLRSQNRSKKWTVCTVLHVMYTHMVICSHNNAANLSLCIDLIKSIAQIGNQWQLLPKIHLSVHGAG
jgi:hypothetical protein